jgi:hypothetical protein
MTSQIFTLDEIATDLRLVQAAHGINDKEMSDALRLFGASIGAPIDISDLIDSEQ